MISSQSRVADAIRSKFPVFIDTSMTRLDHWTVRDSKCSTTVAKLYESFVAILVSPERHDWRQFQYDEPDFDERLDKYMRLRLFATPEDRLRFYRQEEIKRYFRKRNTKIKILSPDVDIPDPPDDGTLYIR